MPLTDRQLNRATLGRQLLLRREKLAVVEAVHRVVALQAQEAVSPYLALWNRLKSFDPADLDQALAAQSVVKASLMRITLHAVDATDYPAFHQAMQPSLRAARLNDRRFKVAGLSIDQADDLVPHLQKFANKPRTNADFESWLDDRLGVLPRPGVWWAMRTCGPFWHAPTGGPWSFGPRPSYIAARARPKGGDVGPSMQGLVRRYLEGFGPATAKDIAQFSTIYVPPIRDALRPLVDAGDVVCLEGANGSELYDVPGGLLPPVDSPAPPRLMAMWDSVLLAYADRARMIPAEYRKHVMRNNGDVLPTLLVDGCVAGVWRPVERGIEATAFHRLSDEAWKGLAAEARGLLKVLADREPTIYRRYAHWWTTLPSDDVRVLPG